MFHLNAVRGYDRLRSVNVTNRTISQIKNGNHTYAGILGFQDLSCIFTISDFPFSMSHLLERYHFVPTQFSMQRFFISLLCSVRQIHISYVPRMTLISYVRETNCSHIRTFLSFIILEAISARSCCSSELSLILEVLIPSSRQFLVRLLFSVIFSSTFSCWFEEVTLGISAILLEQLRIPCSFACVFTILK